MKRRILAALICILASGAATCQTARSYFNELRDANGLDHYGDEYACFPNDDNGGFSVIAKSKEVEKKIAANTRTKVEPIGEFLLVTPYFKGVASDTVQLYEKMDKNSEERWSVEYTAPIHGKNVYLINWSTGRYRFQVYALDHSTTRPASETSGKCELIHAVP